MRSLTLILAILFCSSAAFSQITLEDTTVMTRTRWRDTCFGLINKNTTNIPSGYLIDYSLAEIDAAKWDGVGTNDTIKDYGEFFYYHNILELSAVNGNALLQATNDLYVNAMRYKRDSAAIPILMLYQPYQKINSNALSNNLFTITSDSLRLQDVSGRSSSPYDNQELFIFSPVQTEITQFGFISFKLPASLWQMPGINSVSIDFGDGSGARTISKGGFTSVYYSTEGYKYITTSISTSGGTRTAKTRILFKRPPFYMNVDTSWNVSVSPVFASEEDYLAGTRIGSGGRTFTSTCPDNNVFLSVNCDIDPGAEVRIINGCDGIFDRPVIIIEGFDQNNSLSLDVLVFRFSFYRLLDNMLNEGFDFVFVNLTKPTDYIENNAKVLEEIINEVNSLKNGNAEGTIIGYSLGGIIARWCLKDMEDRSLDHEIENYFSYDSPHQGANVPLGMQFIFGEMQVDFDYLKWIRKDFRELVEAANSPAAKQILVTKADYLPNGFPSPFILNPVRARFAQQLAEKDYPTQVVRYGISMGRGNNTANTKDAGNGVQFGNFVPGDKIFDGAIIAGLANLTAAGYAVPENNTTDYIARYRFVGLKVVKLFGFPVTILPTIKIRNFKYTGQNSYDDAPGGNESTQQQFTDRFGRIIGGSATTNGHPGHCFIPTVSALDLQNQGYNSTNKWQSNNLFFDIDAEINNPGTVAGNDLATPARSPFDFVLTNTSDCAALLAGCITPDDFGDNRQFITADWNQYHNSPVSLQVAQFIERKIRNAAPGNNCPSICGNTSTIQGDDIMCAIDGTYQLASNNQPIANILWEVVNGTAIITNGQGTPTVDLVATGVGNDILRVTITNLCGQTRVIQRTIQIGVLMPTFDMYAPNGYCSGSGFQASAVPNNSGTVTYNWWVNGVLQSHHGFKLVRNFPANTTRVELQVVVFGCGFSPRYIQDYTCGSPRIAPNPASAVISIQAGSPIKEVHILDKLGIVKKIVRFPAKSNNVKIDVAGLRSDIYTLRIYDGSKWTTQLLSIQK
jgi:hypothetical protein